MTTSTSSVARASRGQRLAALNTGNLIRQYGIVGALIVLVVVGQILYPGFLDLANVRDLLAQNASIGIIAVGMTIIMISGGFDLSVGSVYALSATLFAGLSMQHSVWLAGLVAIVAGLACGFANGVIVTRLNVNPFIATLGTSSVILGAAYIYSNSEAFVVDSASFGWMGNTNISGLPFSVLVLGVSVLFGGFLLAASVFGRNVYAVGGNREAARLSGIRVSLVTVAGYAFTGVLASLAGMLDASRLGVGQANVGASLSLDVIAVVVIGGTSLLGGEGAMWRTVVGLLTLAALTNLFYSLNVTQNWQLLAKGSIIVIAVAADAALRRRS